MLSSTDNNAAVRGAMRLVRILSCLCLLSITPAVLGQQSYVGKYDLFAGYTYMNSPKLSLVEHGVHIQAGVRPRSWVSLGLDYSRLTGDGSITPDLLPAALEQSLATVLEQYIAAGVIPSTYSLKVPLSSVTQTFAAGPQFSYHRFRRVTPFIRPSIGAIHEVATPEPGDAVAAVIVKELAPSGKKRDWTGFYGVGMGCDIFFGKHFGIRVQGDFVRDHLFNDVLKDSRNTVRLSIGPTVQFGRNMAGER